MGLEMFAGTLRAKPPKPTDFSVSDELVLDGELAYWRKHPNLHGWMEKLYREKGGTAEFNCTPVELIAEDLDRLEADIRAGSLPATGGFFFGSDADDFYREDDLTFIRKAREAISRGETVYYDSWW